MILKPIPYTREGFLRWILLFALLLSKPFVLAAQSVKLAFIFITLDNLSFLLSLLCHQLITDQRRLRRGQYVASDRASSSPEICTDQTTFSPG